MIGRGEPRVAAASCAAGERSGTPVPVVAWTWTGGAGALPCAGRPRAACARRRGVVVMVATPKKNKPRPPLPKDPLPDDGAFLPVDLIDEDEIGPSKDPRRRARKRRKNEKPIGYREYIKKIRKCYKTWKKMRGTHGIQELLVKLSYGLNVDWRNSMNVKALRRKFRAWRARGGAPSEDEYKEAVKMVTDPTITQEQIELGHRVVEALQAVKVWQRTEKMPPMDTLRDILIDLAQCGAYKEIRQVIREMLRQEREVDAEMFFCLLHACVLGGHMEGASATLKRMKGRKVALPVYMYNYVIRAWSYSREQRYNGLVRTFEIEMKNRRIEADMESYEVIFDGYARTQNVRDAPKTWETMRRRRIDPSVECYSGYINCYASVGDVLACRSLWTELHQRGLEPSANTYGAMIRSYANARLFAEASEVEADMHAQGHRPTLRSHNAMICAHVRIGDMDGAIRRFVEMRTAGVTPDVETYGLLVEGFADVDDVERSVAVYRYMEDCGLKPHLAVYNAVLTALAKAGRYEEAKKLILKFRKGRHVVPDNYSLKCLLDACANAGFLGGAKDAFHTMMMILQLRPTIITWNAMLRACAVCGDLEAAKTFMRKLKRNKRSRENSESYNWMAVAHANARDFEGLRALLTDMARGGYSWTLDGAKAQVIAFRSVDDLDGAAGAFEEMLRQRVRPDVEVCNEMIEMYLDQEQLDEALTVFVEMQQLDVAPDTRTYNALIRVQALRGARVEVRAVHEEMQLRGVPPDAETFCRRIEAFGSFGDLFEAVGVFLEADAPDAPVAADTTVYAALIRAHARNGDLEGAVETFRRLRYRGLRPDTVAYTALIEAYSVCGDAARAMAAYRDMEYHNIPLSAETYATVIRAHGRAGDMAAVERKHRELRFAGAAESTTVVNALIFAHCADRQPARAQELMRGMQRSERDPERRPNSETYEMVLGCLADAGMVAEAEALWSEMVGPRRLRPQRGAFVAMARAHAHGGDVDAVRACIEQMRAYGRMVGEEPYVALLDAYRRGGDVEGAEAVLAEMRAAGVAPEAHAHGVLAAAYCEGGMAAEALAHTETARDEAGVEPQPDTLELLTEALVAEGRHEDAERTFAALRDAATPSDHTVAAVMRSRRGRGLGAGVDELFRALEAPSAASWNEWLANRAAQGQVQDVLWGYLRMQASDVVPDATTYHVLTAAHHAVRDTDGVVWCVRKWGEAGAPMDVDLLQSTVRDVLAEQGKLPARRVWRECLRWGDGMDAALHAELDDVTEEERQLELAPVLAEREEARRAAEIERELDA